MKMQIKHRYSFSVLFECEARTQKEAVEKAVKENANLRYAYLEYANLRYADLRYANLENANLGYANLENANLRNANLGYTNLENANLRNAYLGYANLRYADLRYANLENANLENAENIRSIYQSSLSLLHYQKKPFIAFKYLDKNLESPYQKFSYEIGKAYKFDLDEDIRVLRHEGGNVATLEWCLRDTHQNIDDYIYVEVEIPKAAKLAIPYNSDGKFRVSKFKVVRKLTKKELKKALEPLYPSK